MNLRDFLYRSLRLSNDIRAVQRGRIGQRLWNRLIGKLAGRMMR